MNTNHFWSKQKQPYECFYCSCPIYRDVPIGSANRATIDHFVPRHSYRKKRRQPCPRENRVPACRRCNEMKANVRINLPKEKVKGTIRFSLGDLVPVESP